MPLTDEQRSNCEKLATYLESLPEDYEHFNMSWWFTTQEGMDWETQCIAMTNYAIHNGGVASCGTAACAAGHGPAAGVLFRDDELTCIEDGLLRPNWNEYSHRFADDDDNYFIFSGGWVNHDPHHYAAAARIRYLLANEDAFEREGHPSAYDYQELMTRYRPFDKRYPSTLVVE